MLNVMKAQIYQLFRSKVAYVIMFVALFFVGCSLFMELSGRDKDLICGSYMMATLGETNTILIFVIVLAYTATICGGDMRDKTINYEALTGIKRRDIYYGRVTVALLVNVIASAVVTLLPLLIITLKYGWGHTMSCSDAELRMISVLFPTIRLTAFFVFLTFLLKNRMAVYAVGYILSMIELILSLFINELFDTELTMYIFSMDCFDKLLHPKNLGFGFFDGKDITVVKDALERSTAYNAIAAGVIGTAVFLALGYAIFSKRDMD